MNVENRKTIFHLVTAVFQWSTVVPRCNRLRRARPHLESPPWLALVLSKSLSIPASRSLRFYAFVAIRADRNDVARAATVLEEQLYIAR